MICRIADLVVEFSNPTPTFEKQLKNYAYNGKPEATLTINGDDLERLRTNVPMPLTDFQLETTLFFNKFSLLLPLNNAMVLHSSLIKVAGEGIAFAALSGTGKTTHTLLWQRLLGDKMTIINGDKPIIRRYPDGRLLAHGTPWQGKENYGENSTVPLKHICFIERSEENSCERIAPQEILPNIFSQIFIPKDPLATTKTLELLNHILNSCTVWRIKCNMDISAAETAYNAIFGGKQNET